MLILVTGADGHLARAVIPKLKARRCSIMRLDLPFDVCDFDTVNRFRVADFCIHLAGLKYADRAELDPISTVRVNVTGTEMVRRVFGERMVLASTCKAADPETVYGASKLIAERLVLEAGGRVVRLVNVLGSVGSVTDIWGHLSEDAPLPVCNATRLFMSSDHAADMFVSALGWPGGRYGPREVVSRHMDDVATELYPSRSITRIPLRRGDRQHERLLATCETAEEFCPTACRIEGIHDPTAQHVREALAA